MLWLAFVEAVYKQREIIHLKDAIVTAGQGRVTNQENGLFSSNGYPIKHKVTYSLI